MTAEFKDYFSIRAADYVGARPRYPAELFGWFASIVPGRDLALDCATGNGQAALGLAEHFHSVVATDASRQQIGNAFPHVRISYRVAPADFCGLQAHSVDLVTVAQAFHWFDRAKFYSEVKRVLKPGAVLAVWCYGLCRLAPNIDAALRDFYHGELGPYWPPERRLVDAGYRGIEFPFEELKAPDFRMSQQWGIERFIAYLRTWSAVPRYMQSTGHDPLSPFTRKLRSLWGNPADQRRITWPLFVRAGRSPA